MVVVDVVDCQFNGLHATFYSDQVLILMDSAGKAMEPKERTDSTFSGFVELEAVRDERDTTFPAMVIFPTRIYFSKLLPDSLLMGF